MLEKMALVKDVVPVLSPLGEKKYPYIEKTSRSDDQEKVTLYSKRKLICAIPNFPKHLFFKVLLHIVFNYQKRNRIEHTFAWNNTNKEIPLFAISHGIHILLARREL